MLYHYFSKLGYTVYTATAGNAALKEVEKNPDIILLDVNMPDIDGFTVCEKIRDYISCPIIFLTARIEDSDKIKGFSIGADDYVIKPFSVDELEARIVAHLRREKRRNVSSVEFVDDGYSGTNFNRPAFRKMMEEVKRGKIQCIMVKDFSRFARNFLDAGEYLEQIFPFLGVRFISVNDHYDSDTKEGTAGDWDVVFKNFLYDLYSKELSKKTTAAKRSKARKGEYLGRAPIGYVRSKERKNQLEIEPEGAKIVRFIFDMALSGHTIPEIVKMLNQSGIPTPGTLTEKNYKGKRMMVRKNTTVICWQYNMVWGF